MVFTTYQVVYEAFPSYFTSFPDHPNARSVATLSTVDQKDGYAMSRQNLVFTNIISF